MTFENFCIIFGICLVSTAFGLSQGSVAGLAVSGVSFFIYGVVRAIGKAPKTM
jgi:hypothetical protein